MSSLCLFAWSQNYADMNSYLFFGFESILTPFTVIATFRTRSLTSTLFSFPKLLPIRKQRYRSADGGKGLHTFRKILNVLCLTVTELEKETFASTFLLLLRLLRIKKPVHHLNSRQNLLRFIYILNFRDYASSERYSPFQKVTENIVSRKFVKSAAIIIPYSTSNKTSSLRNVRKLSKLIIHNNSLCTLGNIQKLNFTSQLTEKPNFWIVVAEARSFSNSAQTFCL